MASGNEFLTSNINTAYPFKEGAFGLAYSDPVHGADATLPPGFFVDAHFSVPFNFGKLYLRQLIASGTSFTIVLTNSAGTVQATETVDIAGWSTSPFFYTVEITNASKRIYGKVVLYGPAVVAYFDGISTDTFGIRLPFEDCTVVCRNRTVETFELYTALPATPAPDTPGPISGDVKISSGYNIDTDVEIDEDTDSAVITLSTSTANEAPCEHTELLPYFRGIMQLMPDATGGVHLMPGDDGCYNVIPIAGAGTEAAPFIFMLQGNCTACCSCDDYKNMATAMKRLLDRSQVILTTLKAAHNGTPNGYTAGVEYFNSVIAEQYGNPYMAVSGSRGLSEAEDPLVKSGSPHLLTMAISFKNNSRYPYMYLFNFRIDFTDPTAGWLRSWHTHNVEAPAAYSKFYSSVVYDEFRVFFPPLQHWAFYGLLVRRGEVMTMVLGLQALYPAKPGWIGTVSAQVALWDGVSAWEIKNLAVDFDFSLTDPLTVGPRADPPPP